MKTTPDWCSVHGHQDFFYMWTETGDRVIACPVCEPDEHAMLVDDEAERLAEELSSRATFAGGAT